MLFLLDTNICIYLIKRKPPEVIERLSSLNLAEVGISAITLAELTYGVAKSSQPGKNQNALNSFLAPLEVAPFDDLAASMYGEIRAMLAKKGQLIGSMDLLIAAHAKSLKVTLVTNNLREFSRVPGLNLENWANPTLEV
jgi:tRNA(fMet)-specific endonuclease VapC